MERSFNKVSNQYSSSKYIFLSSSAVFAGGLIYILFRPMEPVFFHWFDAVGIENWLCAVREKSLSIFSFLPRWIIFSLPNGLWAFAYTLIVLSIWTGNNSPIKYFWLSSIPILIFGFEILQLTGDLPGTFCIQDLILGAMGIAIGVIIKSLITKQNNYEKIRS